MTEPKASAEDRFWSNVAMIPEHGCWEWLGAPSSGSPPSYGRVRHGATRVAAHRFAYEMLVGPIPTGLTLDHLCRNRMCVNPSHLEPVTIAVNVIRGAKFRIDVAPTTHCKLGHPLSGDNLYKPGKGRTRGDCRKCRRIRYERLKRARQ
jgi:hypothetical protein